MPVDTNIVTDYAQIIKNPMDFGTMQKKIDTKQYTDISQFQVHIYFLLIINIIIISFINKLLLLNICFNLNIMF